MTYKLNFGQRRVVIRLGRKPGRPKKTALSQTGDFLLFLKKVSRDRRFKGNPVSRVMRRLAESNKFRQLFGANLAAFAVLTGTLAPSISASSSQPETEITTLSPPVIQIATKNSVRIPLDSFIITQGYHYFHQAIDLKEAIGAPIYPIMEGVVKEVIYGRFGYGQYVVIDHGSGFESLYAHLNKVVVKEGERVNQDTVIGTVGTSGRVTGAHLHLEVHDHGQPFNPLTILEPPESSDK